MASLLKIGTCGFSLQRASYYQQFPVVEVQQTFYHPPRIRTAQAWREQAPPGFEFVLKAWQLITHDPSSPTYRRVRRPIPPGRANHYGSFRPTDEVLGAWEATEEIARVLRAKVILFQTPASFCLNTSHQENLRSFFRRIQRRDYLLIWEPRGGWPEQEIEDLCRELDLIHGVDPFRDRPLCGPIRYFRLHGKSGFYCGYTDSDLDWLIGQVDPGMITYIMFNNARMKEDAQRLQCFYARSSEMEEGLRSVPFRHPLAKCTFP